MLPDETDGMDVSWEIDGFFEGNMDGEQVGLEIVGSSETKKKGEVDIIDSIFQKCYQKEQKMVLCLD